MNKKKDYIAYVLQKIYDKRQKVTLSEISQICNCSKSYVNKILSKHPHLKSAIKKETSTINNTLYYILLNMFPYMKIHREYIIGDNKRLDFYIEDINVAIEYNGKQHYNLVNFNGEDNITDLINRQSIDLKKINKANELGINVLTIPFNKINEYLDNKKKLFEDIIKLSNF